MWWVQIHEQRPNYFSLFLSSYGSTWPVRITQVFLHYDHTFQENVSLSHMYILHFQCLAWSPRAGSGVQVINLRQLGKKVTHIAPHVLKANISGQRRSSSPRMERGQRTECCCPRSIPSPLPEPRTLSPPGLGNWATVIAMVSGNSDLQSASRRMGSYVGEETREKKIFMIKTANVLT